MRAKRVRVYGIVQGVGFRPTVSRHARTAGVCGSVCNKGSFVEILIQGTEAQEETFLSLLHSEPPRRSVILKTDISVIEDAPQYTEFSIIESEKTGSEIFISPDIGICDDCRRELYDPKDRRYLHPFINCTCCGPRLTILDALPYDRERTSMKEFPMCPACASEYHDSGSRRFDAQPVCCHECGPEVYLLDRPERGPDAIREARRILASGGVIAVKGIGGFHLCCDASDPDAVALLRGRKRRPAKPFAVMMKDLSAVRRECEVSDGAEELLCSWQKPIVLLPKKEGGRVCGGTAPDNPKLGVMLPYAPLQLLLFDYCDDQPVSDCLVMTSANESGAPICRDDEDARRELGPLCDAILSHDRLIRIRADDTVTDIFEGKPYMIRRSRGFAPLPFMLPEYGNANVLAAGGELKNTFCIGTGCLYYPSPYVGDLTDVRSIEALSETIDRFQTLLEFRPDIAACDLHPGYHSALAVSEQGCPVVKVQHHYAHALSCMAENGRLDTAIGVVFDGTGYGEDGTIWGGEILIADPDGFTRAGHIAPFQHIGGDRASREGWRIAVSMIGDDMEKISALGLCSVQEAQVILKMAEKGIHTIRSTSAGRLFDAVSAVLGIRRASTFEGEAATQLQFAAERCPVQRRPEHIFDETDRVLSGEGPFVLSTDELFRRIVAGRLAGEDAEVLAYRFHLGLAELAAAACIKTRIDTGLNTAVLSGGCFQNTLLLRVTKEKLAAEGFEVLTHSLLPPNDGGIALGQAVRASQVFIKINSQHEEEQTGCV